MLAFKQKMLHRNELGIFLVISSSECKLTADHVWWFRMPPSMPTHCTHLGCSRVSPHPPRMPAQQLHRRRPSPSGLFGGPVGGRGRCGRRRRRRRWDAYDDDHDDACSHAHGRHGGYRSVSLPVSLLPTIPIRLGCFVVPCRTCGLRFRFPDSCRMELSFWGRYTVRANLLKSY